MRLVLALLALWIAVPASAQSAQSARYWIVVGSEGGAETAPSTHALERRAVRGSVHAPRHPDRGVNPDALAQLRALGIEPRHTSRWLGAVSADLTPEQAVAVRGLSSVREVRRVARLVEQSARGGAPLALPVVSPVFVAYGPSEQQLEFVRADEALEAGRKGTGVIFGSLDTLFDFGHPAMSHIPASGHLLGQENFIGGEQSNYHGLATTSIALGYQDGNLVGPAWDATVLAATTEFAPTETHAEEDAFVEGLEWMEAQGADVVSISLGYTVFDEGEESFTYADMDGNTTLVTRASDMAVALGVAVVVAAGNEGNDAWHYIAAPADADSVITVGAANPDGTRAGFSSFGPTADGRTKPDVSALGVDVYVANPGGGAGFGGGTSYATPMVAGVVAQMLGERPNLTPIQVRDALRRTASQANAPDNELGWGIIDAVAAFNTTSTETPPTPTAEWDVNPSVVRRGQSVTLTAAAGLTGSTPVYLIDVLGRRVASWSLTGASATLTVPDLPTGAYFVQVPDADALRITVVR